VVSGSDCGNLFIWDKKSGQRVQILSGDSEVVNVVTGHPYEPMLAVSGIDYTIKIFSADARARKDAALGIGISPVDTSTFPNLGLRRRRRARDARRTVPVTRHAAADDEAPESYWYETPENISEAGGLQSRRQIADEYQIVASNDVDRCRGVRRGFF